MGFKLTIHKIDDNGFVSLKKLFPMKLTYKLIVLEVKVLLRAIRLYFNSIKIFMYG